MKLHDATTDLCAELRQHLPHGITATPVLAGETWYALILRDDGTRVLGFELHESPSLPGGVAVALTELDWTPSEHEIAVACSSAQLDWSSRLPRHSPAPEWMGG